MPARFHDYFYILATIAFTVYGQLVLKWRITQFPPMPADFLQKIKFLLLLVFDPAIFSGFAAAFLASLAWMAAMTKFDLSHAYPFMSLNFVVVLFLSGLLLGEQLTVQKALGVSLIVLGTVVAARG
ncbi:EamA family transporter [Azonexus hydrophilus]|uniref:EamA family transporter n=1 Tax=Azonexus hydrophilus TaxID=418702 RepID=UPI00048F6F7C|nr:EamA family transporter [Azonexus hydrophilus]